MLKELKRGLSAVISAALMSAVCVLPVSADGLPSDGLVMHITFDEANVTSSSFEATVGGTVTKKGNVTYTKSYDNSDGNKAMSIASNTAGNYLELPKGILSGADEAAFAFWIKPTSGWAFMTTPLEQQVFLQEKYLGMLATPAAFTAERYNNSGTRLSSVTVNGDFDDWQYIITEFTQNGTKVYVNGKLKSSDTAAVDIKSLMTADASTWIGHGNWGSGEGFSGKIDDFRVYSRTLSDDEVAALSADARQLEIEKAVAERNCIDAETQFYNGQDKVFQVRPGESVTVKTKITNNKAYPKKVRYHIECDNDAAESVYSEELTLDVLEEKEITAEISNAETGYKIIIDDTGGAHIDAGYLPVSDVSFPPASPADGAGNTEGAHDPSIFKDPVSGHYFAYSTHNTIAESEDLIHWTSRSYNNIVTVPESNKKFVADSAFAGGVTANGTYWAPDIYYKEGDDHPYWFYVSTATNGDPRDSVIGLVKSDSPRIWDGDFIDCGVVLASTKATGSPTNCIDPNIFVDTDGKIYLIWGSFWRGIHGTELDSETGFAKSVDRTSVATTLQTSNSAGARLFSTPKGIAGPEGPYTVYNPDTGFRYLFTSYGWLGSNYNIRVARTDKTFAEVLAQDAHKQFLDQKGRMVGTTYSEQTDTSEFYGYKMSGSFRLGDGIEYVGSGHNSVFRDDDGEWYLIQHCRKVAESIAYLQVKKMLWTEDGWPVISPLVYAGEKEQPFPEEMLYGTWDLSTVGHTIFQSDVTSVNSSGAYKGTDLPVHSSRIILKSDGTLGDGLGTWEFDGDHTVTITFAADGDESEYEFYKSGDKMTLFALTGYDKDQRESAVVLTGTDQNGTTSFAKKNNAAASEKGTEEDDLSIEILDKYNLNILSYSDRDAVIVKASYKTGGALNNIEISDTKKLILGKNNVRFSSAVKKGDKIMVWDSLNGMKPYTEAYTVESVPEPSVEQHNVTYSDENGTYTIYGKFYRPAGAPRGTVIFSHGFNGGCDDFKPDCEYLADNGYAAYSFEFCGGSNRKMSKGRNTTDMTVFTEKADLLAVFDDISKLDGINTENMFLAGGSQGGLISALAAEELLDKVKAMVLYFPAYNIPDNWRSNFKNESDIPATYNLWGFTLGKVFFTTIRDFYPFKDNNIGKYKGDVLIFHGDADNIVPLSYSQQALMLYENADLVVFPGEGHGFSPAGSETARVKLLEFIQTK